jgi:hypothetical protein
MVFTWWRVSRRWIESAENWFFAVAIVSEGCPQEFWFLWKTVAITDSLCAENQYGECGLFVGWMVV